MAILKRRYLAYLLRLWQVTDAGQLVWRASLEDPHSGERQGFASFEALITFLWEQIRNSKRQGGLDQGDDGRE